MHNDQELAATPTHAAASAPALGAARSIVLPAHRNLESLGELLDQLAGIVHNLEGRLEAAYVIDGSPDDFVPLAGASEWSPEFVIARRTNQNRVETSS